MYTIICIILESSHIFKGLSKKVCKSGKEVRFRASLPLVLEFFQFFSFFLCGFLRKISISAARRGRNRASAFRRILSRTSR